MEYPNYFNAVLSLVGGQCSGPTDGPISEFKFVENQKPPTEAEIQTELKKLQDAYNAQAYARARRPLYPNIGDQLDDLYHKGAFSADMTAKIKKVKDDNPKG